MVKYKFKLNKYLLLFTPWWRVLMYACLKINLRLALGRKDKDNWSEIEPLFVQFQMPVSQINVHLRPTSYKAAI